MPKTQQMQKKCNAEEKRHENNESIHDMQSSTENISTMEMPINQTPPRTCDVHSGKDFPRHSFTKLPLIQILTIHACLFGGVCGVNVSTNQNSLTITRKTLHMLADAPHPLSSTNAGVVDGDSWTTDCSLDTGLVVRGYESQGHP